MMLNWETIVILRLQEIGKKCLIGACAVVKRNMPDFSKCATSSSSMVIKQYGENEIEEKLVASKNVR